MEGDAINMAKEGRWMDVAKLEAFYRLGWSYQDIAHANHEATGWAPSVTAVMRKLARMGLPARRAHHRELIQGRIRPEHAHDPIYYALLAISRERQGRELATQDKYRAEWLRDLLTRRGTPLVVVYLPAWGLTETEMPTGWALVQANKDDTDIIRWPEAIRAAGEAVEHANNNHNGNS